MDASASRRSLAMTIVRFTPWTRAGVVIIQRQQPDTDALQGPGNQDGKRARLRFKTRRVCCGARGAWEPLPAIAPKRSKESSDATDLSIGELPQV